MKLRIATCVAALGLASTLSATPVIFGTLNITGSVTVSDRVIDWIPTGGGTGLFDILIPGTGYFSALATSPATYTGDQIDLISPVPVPPLPPGFGVDNFLGNLRFKSDGTPAPAPFNNFHFDLGGIITPSAPACTGGEAVNQSCTLGLFLLTNLGDGNTLIGLKVTGYFEDTNVNCVTNPGAVGCTGATGRYSTQSGQSIGTIKGIIDAGGAITATYSANFESVPEPSTIWLTLAGAGMLIVGRIRRNSSAR